MERLTTRDSIVSQRDINKLMELSNENQFGMNNAYYKLKEYEDLEEQGKLVLYPTYAYCIIGDEVRKGFVFEVTYCVCRKPLYTVRYDDNSLDKHTGYLGISVFLTREEAEEKLKKLQNK